MFGDAEAYERFMGRWSRLVAPLVVDYAAVPENGRMLDVGSGTGSLAFAIAQRRPRSHVLGVDPSAEYVDHANARNPFPDRVGFQVGDAQDLPHPNAIFEASLALLVFNFIPDQMKALREVCRVTKPGGRVSAAVWDYGEGMRMLRVFWDAAVRMDSRAEERDEKYMPLCREGELSKLWKQGGLDHIQERMLEVTMRFESFEDYWTPFLLGQGPAGGYVRTLDLDTVEALQSEVRQRLSLPDSEAPFSLPARVWAVRGNVPSSP